MTLNTKSFQLTEKKGILIITPLGDAVSFRDIDVQREGVEINEYLSKSEIKRLVIDLGRSNYFGSMVIGVINSFGQTMKEAGGQMFVAGASKEMQAIMKVMRLDTLWPSFPTAADAIKVAKAWS